MTVLTMLTMLQADGANTVSDQERGKRNEDSKVKFS